METLSPRMSDEDVLTLSTLALAQVGDAVYELMVRTMLCRDGTASTAAGLHRERVRRVNAPAQCAAADRLMPLLDSREREVFMRGRNTRTGSIPKASTRREYQAATALEALWGWLWLTGSIPRLESLFEVMIHETEN